MGYTEKDTNRSYQRQWWQDNKDRLRDARAERRMQKRLESKIAAIDYLGGGCAICGYNKCLAALDFHHIVPEDKEYEISDLLLSKWDRLVAEVEKCVILCANCHREVENDCVNLFEYIK